MTPSSTMGMEAPEAELSTSPAEPFLAILKSGCLREGMGRRSACPPRLSVAKISSELRPSLSAPTGAISMNDSFGIRPTERARRADHNPVHSERQVDLFLPVLRRDDAAAHQHWHRFLSRPHILEQFCRIGIEEQAGRGDRLLELDHRPAQQLRPRSARHRLLQRDVIAERRHLPWQAWECQPGGREAEGLACLRKVGNLDDITGRERRCESRMSVCRPWQRRPQEHRQWSRPGRSRRRDGR